MTDGFHFMTYESHFMTEPTLVPEKTNASTRDLLNECSFSIILASHLAEDFLTTLKVRNAWALPQSRRLTEDGHERLSYCMLTEK